MGVPYEQVRVTLWRVMESAIIAIMAGAITGYATIKVIDQRVTTLEEARVAHDMLPWHPDAGIEWARSDERTTHILTTLARLEKAIKELNSRDNVRERQ